MGNFGLEGDVSMCFDVGVFRVEVYFKKGCYDQWCDVMQIEIVVVYLF